MSKRKPKLEIYKAKDGWRWRLKASNGAIVAESGEAFRRAPGLTKLARVADALVYAVLNP